MSQIQYVHKTPPTKIHIKIKISKQKFIKFLKKKKKCKSTYQTYKIYKFTIKKQMNY